MFKNGNVKANTVSKKDEELYNKVEGGARNKEQAIESKSKPDFKKKIYIEALKAKRKEITRIRNCIPTNYYGILNKELECISGDIKRAYRKILLQIYLDHNKDLLNASKVFNYQYTFIYS